MGSSKLDAVSAGGACGASSTSGSGSDASGAGSATSRSGAGGAAAGAASATSSTASSLTLGAVSWTERGAPHSEQNLEPTDSGLPHLEQNFGLVIDDLSWKEGAAGPLG